MDNFLNFNATSSPRTKISSIKFLDLNRIIIYADSYNIFQNSNVKNILIYDKNLNDLIQLDNSSNSEIDEIVTNSLHEQKNISSIYNILLNDLNFYKILEEHEIHDEKDEPRYNEKIRLNANLRSIEEQLLLSHHLIQNNEFVMFLEKYFNELIKSKSYLRLVDFFVFYFRSNSKKFFNLLVRIFYKILLFSKKIIGKQCRDYFYSNF